MTEGCNPGSEPSTPQSEGVTPDNPSKALTEAARPDSEGAGHGWWNYRVTKRGSDPEQGLDYEIREVYYRQDGSILGWTEKPCEPYGHSEAGLREDFQLMQEAFERPVLDLDEEEAKRETLPDCEGWVCQSCGADNFIPPGFERAFPPGQTEGGDRAAQ